MTAIRSYGEKIAYMHQQKEKEEAWSDWIRLSVILAKIAFYEQNVPKAGKIYSEIEKHINKADNKTKISAYKAMANYATVLTQNYEKAEQFYFNAIQLSNTNKTTLYLRLCEVYLRKKDYERSLDFAQNTG